ncbi:hypothetical protein ACFWGE_06130 [Streptomyces bacillaris]|uniref:hypothetical protein n=1 Tax=Streptomyces TaxID=1883 RepID=UPI00115021FC|nr:hypothetical protein [Streptomyces cavourensis]TQO30719.1 hypothetical protein FHX79_112556 [Streptomyces cavourensis]WAE66623.1 hypothetical protein OUQ49_13150 [Streptomyces cavourensis]GGU78138.1 hypothetical protein GCM10010498_40150 [Streptomyces cavourensis]
MHDHGDDFGAWCGDTGSATAHRTEEEWLDVARYVRHAANKLLPHPLPLCLPGEPQECGRAAQQHVLAWGAVLKAAAQHVIEGASQTPAHVLYAGQTLYQRSLAEMRERTASPSRF